MSLDISPEFGADAFATYGQSLTFGTDVTMSSFGFEVDQNGPDFGPVKFNAYVYEWTGTDIGAQVFSSMNLDTSSGTDRPGNMTLVTVDTGALVLTAGSYAILFESTSGGPAAWGAVNCTIAQCYDGGNLLFSPYQAPNPDISDTDNDGAQGTGWFVSRNMDSSFIVEVSEVVPQVPVGAALPLLGSSLALMGLVGLRRRKS